LELLHALDAGGGDEKLQLLIRESLLSGLSLEDLIIRSGLSEKEVESALAGLLSRGVIVQVVRKPRVFLSKDAFEELKSLLLEGVEAYVRANPLRDGIGKEELKAHIPKRSDLRFFGAVLNALEKEEKVVADRELVKIPGHRASAVVGQSGLLTQLEHALEVGGNEPPSIKELCALVHSGEKDVLDHLNLLAREERVVKVKADLFYAPRLLSGLQEKLVAYLQEKGEITPPQFRELTGLSRKYMIPLLEYFDQEKLTIRVGDKRVLRKR
jgi:selenocysteine-specific elongation factor